VTEAPVGAARKWAITLSVMMVTVMQVLDTSITNVALPHMQGSFSASIDEMSWVVTSYLAANAVVIPASGWLTAVFGRRRFYLICTTVFTASSFLSGLAPNLEFLVAMRILQGLGGGSVVPMAQAIMWEIFPLEQRGTAMMVWGVGIMMAPILGPTVGGYIADNWSWRWIFYINLPIGVLAFFMVSAFLFDAPFHRRPRHVDVSGILLMVLGFGCLQLFLDLGERHDWLDSSLIVTLAVLAVCMLVGFVIREVLVSEPILDLTVFQDRNFTLSSVAILLVGLGFNSSLLLLALYTQQILGYDAWSSGLTLAPGGLGTMIALMISGRLVSRVDQRAMLAGGCLLQAFALWLMSHVTPTIDFWNLAWPRFLQGFSQGFIFVPLQALSLATVTTERLANATAAYNVLRNIGGSVGVAVATTVLARRSQQHQVDLTSHLNVWNPALDDRLREWTAHFVAQGADTFTAGRRALSMLYREAITQAHVLSYADDFWLLLTAYTAVLLLIPFMHRVRAGQIARRPSREADEGARDPGLPAATD
jgi:MFS transporter, DHA2 family, multidrug resistance protein